jgi:hypothetical protein
MRGLGKRVDRVEPTQFPRFLLVADGAKDVLVEVFNGCATAVSIPTISLAAHRASNAVGHKAHHSAHTSLSLQRNAIYRLANSTSSRNRDRCLAVIAAVPAPPICVIEHSKVNVAAEPTLLIPVPYFAPATYSPVVAVPLGSTGGSVGSQPLEDPSKTVVAVPFENAGGSVGSQPLEDPSKTVVAPISSKSSKTGFKGVYKARGNRYQAQVGHRAIGGFDSAWVHVFSR